MSTEWYTASRIPYIHFSSCRRDPPCSPLLKQRAWVREGLSKFLTFSCHEQFLLMDLIDQTRIEFILYYVVMNCHICHVFPLIKKKKNVFECIPSVAEKNLSALMWFWQLL